MGFANEIYEFERGCPSHEAIHQGVCQTLGRQISATVRRVGQQAPSNLTPEELQFLIGFRARLERRSRRKRPQGEGPVLSLADERMRLLDNHVRPPLYLDLCATTDGKKIVLLGNSGEYLAAACDVIEAFGGRRVKN
jgi:hypothetical protein